jgi:murein DD-endopeptidase MepM/ murein hydrolase activator NlpD
MSFAVRKGVPAFLAAGFILGLGCGDDGPTRPRDTSHFAEDPFSYEVPIDGRPILRIEGVNGSVSVTGDLSATSVFVSGKRRVESDSVEDAEEHLGDISVEQSTSDTEIVFRTEQPSNAQGRNYIVDYTVTLPPEIEVMAVNGNGGVTVRSMDGDVTIEAGKGEVAAEGIRGSTLVLLGNGSIAASVTLPAGGVVSLSTGSGDIDLEIPQDTSASLSATVGNGAVTVSGLDVVDEVTTPKSVTGTLGQGDGTIVLTSGNGNITIKASGYAFYQYPLSFYQVIQEFGHRNPYFDMKYHCAEDAAGAPGTPVYAVSDGVISYSGPMGGYGWLITIDHGNENVYSLYGHLSTRREKMTAGQVQRGDLIAYLADDDEDGSGGDYPDWGPHLHFGIRQGRISDYPSDGDSRWEAGYTAAYPTTLGWLDPTDFINEHRGPDASNMTEVDILSAPSPGQSRVVSHSPDIRGD